MTQTGARLSAIRVSGFKSAMAPVQVELADITVLAGANSAGKSTIMQPLLLLKQTIEKPFDQGPLAIDGPNVRFTNADQMFSNLRANQHSETFEVTYCYDNIAFGFRYWRPAAGGVALESMSITADNRHADWREHQELGVESVQMLVSLPGSRNAPVKMTYQGTPMVVKAARNGARLVPKGYLAGAVVDLGDPALPLISDAAYMIHLPGMRGNPERNYAISSTGPVYPGHFNDYVASIIHDWGKHKDNRIRELERGLKHLGLTWRVTTRALDDTRLEVRVGRLPAPARGGAKDTVSIADVGFGVSQTLPLLVALLAAQPGQFVLIEQPEIHLHPKAQVAMAQLLIEAANRGARLIVETHSSLLILALQAAVADQTIGADRISMNWFTRDAEGQTIVTRADIGADGSYGDWPSDFDEVELDLQDRYMTSADKHHAGA